MASPSSGVQAHVETATTVDRSLQPAEAVVAVAALQPAQAVAPRSTNAATATTPKAGLQAPGHAPPTSAVTVVMVATDALSTAPSRVLAMLAHPSTTKCTDTKGSPKVVPEHVRPDAASSVLEVAAECANTGSNAADDRDDGADTGSNAAAIVNKSQRETTSALATVVSATAPMHTSKSKHDTVMHASKGESEDGSFDQAKSAASSPNTNFQSWASSSSGVDEANTTFQSWASSGSGSDDVVATGSAATKPTRSSARVHKARTTFRGTATVVVQCNVLLQLSLCMLLCQVVSGPRDVPPY